jgi:MATE family multidrug resistance protein
VTLGRRLESARRELSGMLGLAVPVVVVQVGLMAMGVVDTAVVGRVSGQDLAAVALGHLYVMAASAFGFGVLLALDPLVAQAVGAGDEQGITRALQRGLILAAVLAVPGAAALVPGELVFSVLHQPVEVIPIAAGYARISAPGLLPFFAFVVVRQTLQAVERLRPIVVTIVIANLANLGLDLVLVFGLAGAPRLGALGSAWATLACRWLMAVGLLVLARRDLAPHLQRFDRAALRLKPLLATVRIGAPIGGQLQLEMAAFAAVALFMGAFGATQVAAHQVALTLASLTFMVPLGVSGAAAVRVGHAVGAGDATRARGAAAAALLSGAAFMTATGAVFLLLPGALAAMFTDVAEVRELAQRLIPVAGFFQVFDGLQVVGIGVLRGTGDTRTPMVVGILGFWLIGMPVSLVLAFPLGLGPVGLWWGLVAGLGTVAVLLLVRVSSRLSGPLDRLAVE